MSARKPYSTNFDPDIIPGLAKRRAAAHSLGVSRYIEKAVLLEAKRRTSLGEPVHDEAAALARIGSLIAFAITALPPGADTSAEHLNKAKQAIFDRIQALQDALALTQKLRSQEAWEEAGGVTFEGYPERNE